MTASIRELSGSLDDLRTVAELILEIESDDAWEPADMAAMDKLYSGTRRFLAEADGQPVGVATVGRMWVHPEAYDALWATIHVLRAWRRQGIGSRLYELISGAARERGKVALETEVREDRTDGVDFLVHRGFVEHGRDKLVALDIRGMTPPDSNPPGGITFTTLAQRPDLVAGVHAVAVEAFADIPSAGEPIAAGTLEEFTGRDVNVDAILKDGFFVALDDATGVVVGYASLARIPGPGGRAFHDMTAVLRAWRGRGIAGALKRATIAWAIGAGLEVLETGNDTTNAPMRAVNIGLGYQPLPDLIGFRGPLAAAVD